MTIHDIVTPAFLKILGIIVFCIFLLTLLGGLMRKQLAPRLKKAYLPLHRTLAIIAIVLAAIHGGLVLILYGL
jgi:hypothetical protein